MRYLGIDYGTKRIGIATSDEGGTLAFPKEIFSNDGKFFERLADIIKKESAAEIVIGESVNYSGAANKVAADIEEFIEKMEKNFKLPVHKEKEFLTSVEARRYARRGSRVDASAAALILQRYLDKKNN